MTNNKPANAIRLGAIEASIWRNETENGPRYSVTITRLYKDDEQRKTTDSFGRDDLPLAGKVLDMAQAWIFEFPKS
jgi:hypothetical protein